MALRYYKNMKIGEITLPTITGKTVKCEICGGNCLAVIISEDEKNCYLQGFFEDTEHVRRCLGLARGYKENLYKGATGIRINTFYKEGNTLLKYFTKAGFEVTAYYEEQGGGK